MHIHVEKLFGALQAGKFLISVQRLRISPLALSTGRAGVHLHELVWGLIM